MDLTVLLTPRCAFCFVAADFTPLYGPISQLKMAKVLEALIDTVTGA
jgi:hypothetical protein